MDETAARGFARGAEEYRANRPDYPPELIDLLAGEIGLGPAAAVVDLAAGTGKSTALLVAAGADVTAVEPVAEMRAAFEVPGVAVLDGTAEALPLADESADIVCAFQSFHWFDQPAALAEIARVLRPGGGLVLVWNVRDRRVKWVREMAETMEAVVGPLPYERWHNQPDDPDGQDEHWRGVVAADGRFGAVAVARLPQIQEATVDLVVGRAASTSYVAALDATTRAELLAEVRRLVAEHPDLAGQPSFGFPHICTVYWTRLAQMDGYTSGKVIS